MEEKSIPSSTPPSTTPSTSASSASKPKRGEAWRPRVDNSERVLHGFSNETPEADSILESPEVRDPEEDTAPLQGSKDRSDEDSMEDIE